MLAPLVLEADGAVRDSSEVVMVDCARCGYKNDAGSKFCAACGTAMPAPSAGPAAGPSWNVPPPPPAPEMPSAGAQWPPPSPYGAGPPPPGQTPEPLYPPYGAPPPPQYAPPPEPYPTAEAARGQDLHLSAGQPTQPRVGAPAGLNPYAETVGSAGGWPPANWPAQGQPPQEPRPQQGQDAGAFASTARPAAAEPEQPPPMPEPMRYAPPAPPPAPIPVFVQPSDPGQSQPRIVGTPFPSPARDGLDPEQVAADAPRVLAGFLVSFEGDGLGQFWPFHQGRNEVGRLGAGANLDLAIDHPTTSSRHAVLLASVRPSRLKIEDVGSTNGTYANGERIAPGMRQELHDGDAIRFGGFTTTVKLL